MSDPYPSPVPHRSVRPEDKRSFLQKIAEFIHPGPDSRDELIESLGDAEDRSVITHEDREMLEGVIRMAEMTAYDVMVPAPKMDLLDIDAPFEEMLHTVIEAGHSRFPVYEGETDHIIGILMVKDLLKLQRSPTLNVRTLLRTPVFVNEDKPLNDLLREFRGNRNHLAIVVDEYGRVAGLITIEDVLEEIVGEIEDEFDEDEEAGAVFALSNGGWRVNGDADLAVVNKALGLELTSDEVDSIGGYLATELGRVPRRGDVMHVAGWRWEVLHAKGGLVKWFRTTPHAAASASQDALTDA